MPEDVLDQVIEIDNRIDENIIEELEEIGNRLYELLREEPDKFNDWEISFIEDLYPKDKDILTEKQVDRYYKLAEKFL